MAITAVRYLGISRGNRDVSYRDGIYTVTEPIEVITDAAQPQDEDSGNPGTYFATSDPLFFVGDPAFPSIGDEHPANANLRLENITRVKQDPNDWQRWTMGLIFTSKQGATTEQGGDLDFKTEKYVNALIAKKSWSFKSVTAPRRDTIVYDGATHGWTSNTYPVQTTAGEPLNATEELFLPVCNYTRNEVATPANILTLVGSVNSNTQTIDGISCAAKTIQVTNITVSEWKKDQGQAFRTVTYTFTINPSTWDLFVVNRGSFVKASGKEPQRAKIKNTEDGKWVPATSPMNLRFDDTSMANADDFGLGSTYNLESDDTTPISRPHIRRYQHPQLVNLSGYNFD
jgi:hypothetical protein